MAPNAPRAQLWRAGGGYEPTEQTNGRRGTPRNATGRDGTPKFGYTALESTIFWRGPANSLIFLAPNTPIPTPNWGWWGEIRYYRTSKGTPRNAAARYGTWRNAYIWPHSRNPPYFGGFVRNSQFFAPSAPLSQHPTGEGSKMRTTEQTKGRCGKPRNATELYGATRNTYIWRQQLHGVHNIRADSQQIC